MIIPKALTMKVLEDLHREHMGVAKMQGAMCGGQASPRTWKPWQRLVPNVLPVSKHLLLHRCIPGRGPTDHMVAPAY